MERRRYVVSIDVPDEVNDQAMIDELLTAVQSMPGYLSPDDPLFNLNRGSMTVNRFRSVAKEK